MNCCEVWGWRSWRATNWKFFVGDVLSDGGDEGDDAEDLEIALDSGSIDDRTGIADFTGFQPQVYSQAMNRNPGMGNKTSSTPRHRSPEAHARSTASTLP